MSKIKFLGYEIVSMDDFVVSVRITSQTHRSNVSSGDFEVFRYTGRSGHVYSMESDLYPAWWNEGRERGVFKLFLRGRHHKQDKDIVKIPIKHWHDVRDMIELYNGFALPPELFDWEG